MFSHYSKQSLFFFLSVFFAHTLVNNSIEMSGIFQFLQFSTFSFFLFLLLVSWHHRQNHSMALTIRNEWNEPEFAYFYALEKCFSFSGSCFYASYYGLKLKDVLIKEFFSTDFWDPEIICIISAVPTILMCLYILCYCFIIV